MRKILITALIVLSFCFSACTIYKPDIRQGNELEEEAIAKLHTGMTKSQVAFILGSPSLQDPFHKNRWDYIRTLKQANKEMERRHLILFFENELLVRIDKSQLNNTVSK